MKQKSLQNKLLRFQQHKYATASDLDHSSVKMAAVNFHAVAALIVFCYEIPGEEGLHGLFGLKQLILNGEEQVVVQNLQKGTNFGS